VNNFEKQFKTIIESFGSIRYTKRLFYPRKFNLSENFLKSFKEEYKRLLDEGHSGKLILSKLSRALEFHSRR
jgi:hypothetical protein